VAVTVYTVPNCPACDATKRFLERRGIPYQTASFEASDHAQGLAARHGYRVAPVVEAGPATWCGFRPDLIGALKFDSQ
jgi:glutaredoxin-like protein NrdH